MATLIFGSLVRSIATTPHREKRVKNIYIEQLVTSRYDMRVWLQTPLRKIDPKTDIPDTKPDVSTMPTSEKSLRHRIVPARREGVTD